MTTQNGTSGGLTTLCRRKVGTARATFDQWTSNVSRFATSLLRSSANNMLHRRIVRQLISPPQRHVSSTMLKLFCVGCKQRDRLFSSSRRHFQEKANDGDSMDTDLRYNAQILWDYLRIDSPMKKV